jgi:para-aminobenzoate synthetase component 1
LRREFKIKDPDLFKLKVLNWLEPFDTFCFLDSHGYKDPYGKWDWLAAAGAASLVQAPATCSPHELKSICDSLQTEASRWWFGHLSFELKDQFQRVPSTRPDYIGFPLLSFFSPSVLITCKGGTVFIEAVDPESVFKVLEEMQGPDTSNANDIIQRNQSIQLSQRFSEQEYINTLQTIKQHIQQGDCYEINFCQEFFAKSSSVNPLQLYKELAQLSPTPFAALYRLGDCWALSASPERFLCKRGNRLIAQPIKGTARRDHANAINDRLISEQLQQSEKERAENVMIVDLVRNDLSRVCITGTVRVDELFGVYQFPQVYQLISTISGEMKRECSLFDLLKATFPMGSMTGAPKKRVLELTEQYEQSARGLYSGSIGYIDPDGDFDFNVVIRSLLYRQDTHDLSFHVGGGITINSDAKQEWEECLLKASALLKLLGVVQ